MRKFIYDGREFPDPNVNWDPDRVRQSLATLMPGLSNAEVKHRTEGEDEIYEFTRRVGTKGLMEGKKTVVEVIASVPECRLALIDLMGKLSGSDGGLDYQKAAKLQPEINFATAQAQHYIKQTRDAINNLWNLPARSWPG